MAATSRLVLIPAILCLLATAAGCATADPAIEAPSAAGATAVTAADGASALEARDRMVAAMRRPGHVYHRVAQRRQDAGLFSNEGSISHWLDADAGLAREALRLVLDARKEPTATADAAATSQAEAPADDAPATVIPEALPGKPDRMGTAAALIAATQEATNSEADDGSLRGDKIVVGSQIFDLDKALKVAGQDLAPTCPGLSAAVSLVLGCRPGAIPTWTLDKAGRYRGQQALLLTASYRTEDSEEPVQIDSFYLDPATYLPWGLVQRSVIYYGTPEQSEVRADFTHDFIPVAALPAGIFDPQQASQPTPAP